MNKLFSQDADVTLRRQPELPKVEFEANKTKYKATDLRYLNEEALAVFGEIIGQICNDPECEEVRIDASEYDERQLEIITDIVTAISYEYKKGGKNGFSGSSHLITASCAYRKGKDETPMLIFFPIKDHAKIIYEYAKGKKQIDYCEMVVAVVEESHKRLAEWMQKAKKNDGSN